MIVGKSTLEYVFIQALIYTFSYLGLACLIYFYLALSIGGVKAIAHPVSIFIEVVGAIEVLFYLFWYLPYRHYLHKQRPAYPPPLNREQRRKLWTKAFAVTSDLELFISGWMCGAHIEDLRRENIKEWLLWTLFDRDGVPGDDDEELEEYLKSIEEALGRNIKPGWGPATSLRLNFDRFTVRHKALLFHMIIGFTDFMTSMLLLIMGFSFYRQPRAHFLKSFPFRPLTLLSPKQSASPNLSYFFRAHRSTTHRPVVLIHGVGIGLAPYIPLLAKLPKDIGILAIEILPISSRVTTALPLGVDLARECGDIISQQDLKDFVFVGNSYGTLFTKLFLDSTYLSNRMDSIIMLDPVAVLLHFPDLTYNFTKREPKEANEWQLWWAAQTDPDIAYTLGRRFCWHDHVVWREELLSRPTTLIIGSEDSFVNSEVVAKYIIEGAPVADPDTVGEKPVLRWTWQDRERFKAEHGFDQWRGGGLELVWLEGYDHGSGFLSPKMLPRIVDVIVGYCEMDANGKGDVTEEGEEDETELASKREPGDGEVNA